MSLEKGRFTLLSCPCLSLSLLFCHDLCSSRGAVVESPDPHSLWRVGGGFSYLRRPLQEGGIASRNRKTAKSVHRVGNMGQGFLVNRPRHV